MRALRLAPGRSAGKPLRAVLVAAAAMWLAGVAPVAADHPTQGQLIVTGDHINPGQPFTITGYDIDPLIELDLAISNGTRTANLGKVSVAGDGKVSATVTLPGDFPNGYANITATSAADGVWTTAVLVGERSEGPQAPAPNGPIDDRTIGLILLGVGLVVCGIAGATYLRGRSRRSISSGS